MVITVSGTTLQLLDDSNLQAVAAAGEEKSSAARRTLGRPSTMDGWMGGSWVSRGLAECLNCNRTGVSAMYAVRVRMERSAAFFAAGLEAP